MPRLAEFVRVIFARREPVRDPTLLLAPVREASDFFRFHDEARRLGCDGLGDDDPPVPHERIDGLAERDRRLELRQCLDLNAQVAVGGGVVGQQVDSARVPRSRHDVPTQQRQAVGGKIHTDIADYVRAALCPRHALANLRGGGGLSHWRRRVLKPDAAPFSDRCFFDGVHLTFQAREFGGVLIIAFGHQQYWPKDNETDPHGYFVVGGLLILNTGSSRSGARNALSFLRQLRTGVIFIEYR